MGWYGRLARTKAYFRTFTYHFQVLFFSYVIEICASDRDTFYFKLTKCPCCHFCLLLALTRTLRKDRKYNFSTVLTLGDGVS